ncbi:MAG: type IV pilin protein [Gammaproteobacteria bacterium]
MRFEKKSGGGYSLTELLVVLTITGILLSIASVSWQQVLIKQRRSEATAMLFRIAGKQELFRLQHQRYADSDELSPAPPDGLGVMNESGSRYRFSSNLTTTGFTAAATPSAGGSQATDSRCQLFSIDESGQITARTDAGEESTQQCWQT